MIIINLKDLYPSDSQQVLTEKTNYNFNQLLRLGVGQPGIQGLPGIQGGQGIPGMPGIQGVRGSYWYSGAYDTPVNDPNMSGSPNPKNINDCYLSTASGYLIMWQYQSPGTWVQLIDIDSVIASHMTMVSPFERSSVSAWANSILPLPTPSGNYNNNLVFASEFQNLLHDGVTYSNSNIVQLQHTQLALLNGSVVGNVRHSLMIGEVGYDYVGIVKDTANPKVQINNTLRISAKYKVGTPPAYATASFDMYSPDDGLLADDVTTMMSFTTRHFDNPVRGSMSVLFTGRRALTGYGYALDDIMSSEVDFGGIVVTNTAQPGSMTAIAMGTNMNFGYPTPLPTPYAYLLTNNNLATPIDRLYINNNVVPFRKSTDPSKVLTLGLPGNSGNTHWDSAFLKYSIAHLSTADLKIWRGSESTGYMMTQTNCSAAFTKEGRFVIGKSLTNYKGAGTVYGLYFGNNTTSNGNLSNKAVLHIYEEIAAAPTIANQSEAGLMVEKRWKFLDRTISTQGTKMGMWIQNAISVAPAALGLPGGIGAPNAIGLGLLQGQESSDLTGKGYMNSMYGISNYNYVKANSANIGLIVGITTGIDFQLSGGTTVSRADEFRGYEVNVPGSYLSFEPITGLTNYMPKKYGIYQYGANNALNYFTGHIQFSGTGAGYNLPGIGGPTGHVINVLEDGGTGNGNLSIMPGSSSSTNAGSALSLYGGYSLGGNGGAAGIQGGTTNGTGKRGGDVTIMAGLGISDGSTHTLTGGDLYLSGGMTYGATSTPGNVTISPGIDFGFNVTPPPFFTVFSAGTIAIGYAKQYNVPFNTGLVGIGTSKPKEKLHVMGNIAIGGNSGLGTVRRIYVRPGATGPYDANDVLNVDGEAAGRGAHLAIRAGDGSGFSSTRAGSLYLTGGQVGGVFPPDPLTYQGNVIIGKDENSFVIGRIGMRASVPADQTVHVEIDGNVRLHTGDIMSGSENTTGWHTIIDVNGVAALPAGFKLYQVYGHEQSDDGGFSWTTILQMEPHELTSSFGHHNTTVKFKRIGSTVLIRYNVNLYGTAIEHESNVIGTDQDKYDFRGIVLAWDPTAVVGDAAWHGTMSDLFNGADIPNQPNKCTITPGIMSMWPESYLEKYQGFPTHVNIGKSSAAWGDVPINYNVMAFLFKDDTLVGIIPHSRSTHSRDMQYYMGTAMYEVNI